MSKRAMIVLAAALLLLVSGFLWGGAKVRDVFLELHGRGSSAHASTIHPAAQQTAESTPLLGTAHAWVAAFNAGEGAMRTFLENNVAPSALKQRSTDERMKGYRTLRARFRSLEPKRVLVAKAGTVEMALLAADGSENEFIFTGETTAPFKLVSIGLREVHYGH